MGKIFILIILTIFLNGLVNASTVTVSPSTITQTLNQGQDMIVNMAYIIQNTDNSSSSFNLNFGGCQFLSSNVNTIPVDALSTASGSFNINISVPSNTNPQSYSCYMYLSSLQIPVNLLIEQASNDNSPSSCEIEIFPTTLSNVKISQGEKKVRNIQFTVPSCFNSAVTIQGVILQTDSKPINLGELSLGNIQSGNAILIPIDLDATDVGVGTYQDQLLFSVYNSTGSKLNVPQVSISVTVTSGITPILGGITLSDLPICSLSTIDMNLNSTAQLTCSKPNPNIKIRPIINRDYITGIDAVDTNTNYIYYFRGTKYGNTLISAEFIYNEASIGSGYDQEIRISAGPSIVSGTTMEFIFYQGGVQKVIENISPGDVAIQLVDNSTSNIIHPENYLLYLNGQEINNTFELSANIPYDLRASSNGYIDRVLSFTLSPQEIQATIPSPIIVGEFFNITTNPENVTIMLDDYLVDIPFFVSSPGEHVLRLSKEGYTSSTLNITAIEGAVISTFSSLDEVKKGAELFVNFTKPGSWKVIYQKNSETIEDEEPYASGIGTDALFKAKKSGIYNIYFDDKKVHAFTISSSNFILDNWLYFLIGIIVIGGIVAGYFVFKGDGSSEESNVGFTMGDKE